MLILSGRNNDWNDDDFANNIPQKEPAQRANSLQRGNCWAHQLWGKKSTANSEERIRSCICSSSHRWRLLCLQHPEGLPQCFWALPFDVCGRRSGRVEPPQLVQCPQCRLQHPDHRQQRHQLHDLHLRIQPAQKSIPQNLQLCHDFCFWEF